MMSERKQPPGRIPAGSMPTMGLRESVAVTASLEDDGSFAASLRLGKGSTPFVASTFEELLVMSRREAQVNRADLASSGYDPDGPVKVRFQGFIRGSGDQSDVPLVSMVGSKDAVGYMARHVVDDVPIAVRAATFEFLRRGIIAEADRVLAEPGRVHHFTGNPRIELRLDATV